MMPAQSSGGEAVMEGRDTGSLQAWLLLTCAMVFKKTSCLIIFLSPLVGIGLASNMC